MKVYSGPLSMFGAKVEIAAREKSIAFDLVMVPFDQASGYEPRNPEVLRVNPKRQVPVLIDGDLEIFDSTQIFEYLEDRWPEPALWPSSPMERARARQLELKSDEVFFPHVIRLMGLEGKGDSPERQHAHAGIERYYDEMNRLLAGRDYLVGTYTFADIAFYMAQYFAARKGVPMSNAWPLLNAWRHRVARRPAVAQVIQAMEWFLRRSNEPIPAFALPLSA